MPQTDGRPTASSVNVSPPSTGTGTRLEGCASPMPSCPLLLLPQQYAAPAAVKPQTCRSPTTIRAKRVGPLTSRGTTLGACDPSPSCPDPFAPQQSTTESDRRAQLKSLPAPMSTMLLRNDGGPAFGGSGTGTRGGGPGGLGITTPGGGPGMPPFSNTGPPT